MIFIIKKSIFINFQKKNKNFSFEFDEFLKFAISIDFNVFNSVDF